MTPRERVLMAIDHKEPDRVPRDLGSTPSSGISAIAYNRLVVHMGLNVGPAQIYDVVQQLAQPDLKLLDRFGVDVLDVGRTFNTNKEDWKKWRLSDGSVGFIPQWVSSDTAKRWQPGGISGPAHDRPHARRCYFL